MLTGWSRTATDCPLRPRCPGTSQDNPGCPSWGGRARSGPRCPGTHPGTTQDVPAVEAVLGPRVPGPRCSGTPRDNPGCPSCGGSVRSQSPRSKMFWDTPGQPRMSQLWRQGKVPESQVQDVRDILGCSRAGGSVRSQSPRFKMSWEILGHPRMSQSWRQC